MKVLAFALALALPPQALALALRENSWPCPCQGQDFDPKTQATWLLYVCALLALTAVSRDSLPFLV